MSRSLFGRLSRRYGPRSGFSRREFLQLTMAASAGWMAGCVGTREDVSRAWAAGRTIVIVGGGFAGLACAHELAGAGYNVKVLEARPRAGGRVRSFGDFVPGKIVEGGGEFIGTNHPAWLAYAKKFQLKLRHSVEEDDLEAPILFNGHRLTEAEGKALHDEMKRAYATMIADAKAIDADAPWRSANADALDRKSVADWLAGLGVSKFCRAAITSELQGNNGAALARQSYLGNLAQIKGGGLEKYWTESEVLRCEGGNQQLAVRFGLSLGPGRLFFNKPVAAIDFRNWPVRVTCADGEAISADEVVLAVPPSVWEKIQFTPDLPAALQPQMGDGVKYLAAVKRRFWKDAQLAPDSASDGMISMTWEGTDGQAGDDGACLTAFSGGPSAEVARRRWAEERDAAYQAELEKLYPKFTGNFTGSRFMDWAKEEWTGALYSCPAPGQVTTVGPLLREGMERLHFAGEHTCFAFVGYMEGALQSGAAAARRLMRRDRHAGSAASAPERLALQLGPGSAI